jgi:hypothetical protein
MSRDGMLRDGMSRDGMSRTPRGLVWLAALVTAVWFAVLLVLAATTANPVTLNRQQLLASDVVVVAAADPGAAREGFVSLRIEDRLAGREVPTRLRVGGIELRRLEGAERHLVPLRLTPGGWVVTPTPYGQPLVYPATEETLRVAKEILTTGAPRPYE